MQQEADANMTQSTEVKGTPASQSEAAVHNGEIGIARLDEVLADGPSALREQIRYVLMLSQLNSNHPAESVPYHEPILTTRQARLKALTGLADDLSESQIIALLKDIVQIREPAVRLPLLVHFALKLPAASYKGMIRDVWKQASALNDAAVRARILYQLAPLLSLVHDEPGTPSPLLQVLGIAQAIRSTEARIRSLIALAPYLPIDFSLRVFRRVLGELTESQNDTLVSKALTTLAPHLPGELVDEVIAVAQTVNNASERARALTALARHMNTSTDKRLHELALETIDRIEDENDRAEALMAFAPNLEHASEGREYPIILEKALTSTIILTRRKLRAQVLVTLAPHLTVDLQGEALAAVHSLESERERANLLAKLAPNLPSDMLVASLAVAHTMRERDCRVQALAVLAQYVPESARHQTTMDALAAASNLPNLYERVQALVEMVDMLPGDMQEQALQAALQAASEIDNANAQSRALSLLGGKLPRTLVPRALELAQAIDNPQQRFNALLGMIDNLSEKQKERTIETLIATAKQMPLEYKKSRALVSIAPHLPGDKLSDIETLVAELNDPIDQVSVYITIAQNLPPEQRPPLIHKASERVRRIEEGYDRASATAAVAPFLAEEEQVRLPQAAAKTINAIADEYDKASAITLLAPLLADGKAEVAALLPDSFSTLRQGLDASLSVQNQQLRAELLAQGAVLWAGNASASHTFELWGYLARQLVSLPMADVLLCLGSLAPIFRELGGDDAMTDIAHLLGMR